MDNFCKCAQPVISGISCFTCLNTIDPETRKLLQQQKEEIPGLDHLSLREQLAHTTPEGEELVPKNEEILYFKACSIKGRVAKDANFVGFAVLTKTSIFLLKKRVALFGNQPFTKEIIPIHQITGIDHTFEKYLTVKSHHVRITRANNEDVLYGLSEDAASTFVTKVNDQSHKKTENSQVAFDPIEQLTKLAALLEKGLLSKEEFEKKKKELLGL